jgi:ubiquinone/menaquinone biosynthesis C-methylase UbiE
MNQQKQVDKSQYEFDSYMRKPRWNSIWHQVDEIMELQPKKVLEIGPGPGLFKHLCALYGLEIETLDVDPDLKPDYVASATALPFSDRAYDVICAFQMLEHLPYQLALQAFQEMVRVSEKHVVISLPDAKKQWRYCFHIPKFGAYDFLVSRPSWKRIAHVFDGEHYWEINKKGYELDRVIKDLTKFCTLEKTYRVRENPYHRFFIFNND